MQPALRDLYTHAQNEDRTPVELSTRQRETRTRILTLAQSLMARFGTPLLKFSAVAAALHVTTRTLRFHFPDLDALLSALLVRHLDAICAAISEIPNNDPNCYQNRRAAYFTATRTPAGTLTPAHTLLVRDRHFLPEDELTPLEAYRHQIGVLLAGDLADFALGNLDLPHATQDQVEHALHNLRAAPNPAARPLAAPLAAPRPAAPRPASPIELTRNVAFVPPPSVFAEFARQCAESPRPATGPP
jgi:AcrR family transcriptional regulator